MRAKEYLSRLRWLKAAIEQDEAEAARLMKQAADIQATDYTRDRVQSSGTNEAPYARQVEMACDVYDKTRARLLECERMRATIIEEIRRVTDAKHMEILYKRYVEFKPLEVVACEMNYSYAEIRDAHGRALQDFAKENPHIDEIPTKSDKIRHSSVV